MSADLLDLVPSWELHLRAERESAQTIKVYGDGVCWFPSRCEEPGEPPILDRRRVARFVAALLERGR